jgi:hypothetical protein
MRVWLVKPSRETELIFGKKPPQVGHHGVILIATDFALYAPFRHRFHRPSGALAYLLLLFTHYWFAGYASACVNVKTWS